MKARLFCLMTLFTCGVGFAQSSSLNLAIPASPQSYQSDTVRAGDLECSHAIGSATNLEFGVVGIINNDNEFTNNTTTLINPNLNNNNLVKDVGVYARITIPIGAPKQRLNCNILYELELEKKRLEVFKLRQEIDRLKNLQFENK